MSFPFTVIACGARWYSGIATLMGAVPITWIYSTSLIVLCLFRKFIYSFMSVSIRCAETSPMSESIIVSSGGCLVQIIHFLFI